ncbi:MAG: response regulator [Nanobdellota archaeon]
MKVLLVDDSAFMRNMIKEAIKDNGHEIEEAGNGEDAIKKANEFNPDIIFLDIVMPGMTGVDALKEIKKEHKDVHVVMCTSVGGQQKIIDEAVSAGASDFIVKPFQSEDILKAIDSVAK